MRQNFARQADCNALHSLGKQEWKFHRQRDRFLLASVIAELPFGDLGIEEDLVGELGNAGFDVPGGGGVVARGHISPVSLGIEQELFLAEIDDGIHDGHFTVRMVLRRLSGDIRHLVQPSIVHDFHGMENSALHWFEAVVDVRHGAFQNHIAGVIHEPVAIHLPHMSHPSRRLPLGGHGHEGMAYLEAGGIGGFRLFSGRLGCCWVIEIERELVFWIDRWGRHVGLRNGNRANLRTKEKLSPVCKAQNTISPSSDSFVALSSQSTKQPLTHAPGTHQGRTASPKPLPGWL